MKRREFMANALTAGIASVSIAGCGVSNLASGTDKNAQIFDEDNLDKLLLKYRDRYHADLFDKFLPNMSALVIDHEYGGFMCSVDIETRKQVSSNKSSWYEGRGLWTYSFLYNNVEKNPAYLEVARKSKDFILKSRPKDDSFWISSFTREGKPNSGPGDIYSSLFVSEGLSEYSKASGESQYLVMAKEIVKSCMERYDRDDYSYHVSYLSPQAPKVPGARVLGHWMIFLRSLTQILEQGPDPEMEKLADRCLDAILNHHLNPKYKLFNELLNHDFSSPDNEFKYFAYTGHGIETCWMLMFEAARRKDRALFKQSTDIFKHHLEVAKDDVYGGYFRCLDHVENNTWKVDKVLWLQEEILIGSLFMAEQTGDPWAQAVFKETFDYVHAKFDKPGDAFWTAGGDRYVDDHIKTRAEHYHHPRHLMLNLMALNRMIEKKGKVISVFG
jgi:N-acylglucosamine 2-epimerase